MIRFIVERNGRQTDIRCPCAENDIRRVQNELEIPYETDTRVNVMAVDSDIEQLEVLEGSTEDLDFLNLLGRLMYGMDRHEYDQFRMGLYHESPRELRDIVNITRAVNRYSIIDPEKLYDSGLDHELDVRGGIPTSEVDITDYSTVARELIDSGKCEKTPYGLLYVNEDIPIPKFFDGKHMPPYFDRDFRIAAALCSGTDEEFVLLPCSDAELLRSAERLGTSFPYDLGVRIEDTQFHNDEKIMALLKRSDINTLNRFARLCNGFSNEENEAFGCVIDYLYANYGGPGDLRNLVKIGEHLDAFTVFPNATDDYELGMSVLDGYAVPEEIEEYFDAERLGEDTRLAEGGRFSENGYVGINDMSELRPYLEQNRGMGGIQL